MNITYHGENYFKIQSGQATILLDPTNQRSLKGADIILSTINPPYIELAKGSFSDHETFFTTHQGEYEVKGIEIKGKRVGFEEKKELTIYRVLLEDLKIGILGHMKGEFSQDIMAFLGDSDLVILPVGSPYFREDVAAKAVRQIEPGVIIPSLYSEKSVKSFIKEMGQEIKPEEKISFKKKDVGEKEMKVVWLKT